MTEAAEFRWERGVAADADGEVIKDECGDWKDMLDRV